MTPAHQQATACELVCQKTFTPPHSAKPRETWVHPKPLYIKCLMASPFLFFPFRVSPVSPHGLPIYIVLLLLPDATVRVSLTWSHSLAERHSLWKGIEAVTIHACCCSSSCGAVHSYGAHWGASTCTAAPRTSYIMETYCSNTSLTGG